MTQDIIEAFLDDTSNQNTRKNKRSALNRFQEWLPDEVAVEEVDAFHLKQWVNEMKVEVSELTIKNYFYDVSSFYSWIETWGDQFDISLSEEENPFNEVELRDFGIDGNAPTRQQKARKQEEPYRALSIEQVEELIQNVPEPRIRNELVVRSLYQTGVRSSELVSIEIGDIDRDNRQIRIDSAKSSGYRTVFYQESLETLLSIYLDGGERNRSMYANSSPYLFLTRQSEQLSTNRVGDIVSEAAENAGIQGEVFTYRPGGQEEEIGYSEVTPHVLRHTFAHHTIHEGERPDIVTLSRVMGHESVETTKKYLDTGVEQRRQEMHRTGPGFHTDWLNR